MAIAQRQVPMADQETPSTLRSEIDQIIQSGREPAAAPGSAKPVFLATLVTGLMLWCSFTPLDFAPAAWFAIVPLCLLLRLERLPRRSYRGIWLAGFIWALATLQWMRLGHVTMYGGLVALSIYLALYLPAFVALGRVMSKTRCPVWLAAPIVWTALEFVRAYLFTGFSWYYLGHSQYQWTSLVQISDLTGAYGVSFLVALSAGAISVCVPPSVFVRLKLADSEDNVRDEASPSRFVAVATSVGLVLLSCGYGYFRMIPTDAPSEGPVVAIAQGNFTPELKHDPTKWTRMWTDHYMLSRAIKDKQPALIVWPETMFPEPDVIIEDGVTDNDLVGLLSLPGTVSNSEAAKQIIKRWRDQQGRELLKDLSLETGSALIIGQITELHSKEANKRYNSATFFHHGQYAGRYDKNHRVIFGEYIPLKSVLPWLAKFTPFSAGFGIDAGTTPALFTHDDTTFAPIICFEDTVPHLVRNVVNTRTESERQPDVLVNLTNDGWFRGSSELDQHLITATFRCIETRRPMIRAVNAGISAYIDSSGRIRQPEHFLLMKEDNVGITGDFVKAESLIDPTTGRRYRQRSAVMCSQIPLDGRNSFYLQMGDWFAILCLVLTMLGTAMGRLQPEETDDGDSGERSPAPIRSAA